MANLLEFQQLQESWVQQLQALMHEQCYTVSKMKEIVQSITEERSRSEEFERLIGAAAAARDKFVEEANLDPPSFLRVIDCKISIEKKAVVIVDWPPPAVKTAISGGRQSSSTSAAGGYTAISHTFGMEVYSVFNCSCAADCRTRMAPRARADPAHSNSPCKDPALHHKIIGDVLSMCGQLLLAGVRYAWHDGVCIAQYHEEEVDYFIQHIAWIYANAIDTVIYLHYIGRPMAPIAPASFQNGPTSRWETRVWTFQEAVLSKRRRYCVRMCEHYNLSDASSYPEFLARLASWYEGDGDNTTTILDETDFLDLLVKLLKSLLRVAEKPIDQQMQDPLNLVGWIDGSIMEWVTCLSSWILLWQMMATSFSTISLALWNCSKRQSKHEGDRMNSILGLAGVHGFNAPKDERLEEFTIEFFKRMRCNNLSSGLALALFTTNHTQIQIANPQHRGESNTWCPTLSSQLWLTHNHFCNEEGPDFYTDQLEFKVQNGNDSCLEVSGPLVCVSLHVNLTDPNLLMSEADNVVDVDEDKPYLEVYLECGPVSATLELEEHAVNSSKVRLANKEVIGFANCPFKLHAIIDHSISDHLASRRSLADCLEEQFNRHGQENTFREFKWSSLIRKYSGLLMLIFPGRVLELDFRPSVDVEAGDRFGAVIVGGDINSQVEKVGCFEASPSLKLLTILQEHPRYLTSLHTLVIK